MKNQFILIFLPFMCLAANYNRGGALINFHQLILQATKGNREWSHTDIEPVLFPQVWSAIIAAGQNIIIGDYYNVSSTCRQHLRTYAEDLKDHKVWAITMYDATGKQGPGLLEGSVTWHGSYDQCIKIRHELPVTSFVQNSSSQILVAHYCSAFFQTPKWLVEYIEKQNLPFPVPLPSVTVDVCLPSRCQEEDLETIIQAYLDSHHRNVSLLSVRCHVPLDISDDAVAIVSLAILLFICTLVAMGTCVDVILRIRQRGGQERAVTLVGYLTRHGSIFSKRGSIFSRHGSVFSRRGSFFSRRSSKFSRHESVKDGVNKNNSGSCIAMLSDAAIDHSHCGDQSPKVLRSQEPTLSEGKKECPVLNIRKESIILQNGTLEPINEISILADPVTSPGTESKESAENECHVSIKKKSIGSLLVDILICFSLPGNLKKTLGEGNSNHLFCLNGIRVLSISWIVLGNTVSFIHKDPDVVENSVVGVEFAQSFWFQSIINSTFAADTFFILSGTLLAYNYIHGVEKSKEEEKPTHFTPKTLAMFYFHRFLRIAPCYYVVVILFTNLLPYFGHGPRWKYISTTVNQCKDYWWANVFFFSNFYKADDMCMSWTYYLVNDFQFYLISPLVLVPLATKPRVGYMLLAMLVMTQIVSVGLLNDKINGNMLRMDDGYFSDVYAKPYCRVGVFAIGMFLGYQLRKIGRRLYLRKFPLLMGWIAALSVIIFVLYVTHFENRMGGGKWSGHQTALYEALSRPAWGAAVSWIILACSIGQGGFVHKLLSWNFFLPLCRITYGVYLLHPLLIIVILDTSRNLIYLSGSDIFLLYAAILISAFLLALVLATFVEGPFIGLEKVLRNYLSKYS